MCYLCMCTMCTITKYSCSQTTNEKVNVDWDLFWSTSGNPGLRLLWELISVALCSRRALSTSSHQLIHRLQCSPQLINQMWVTGYSNSNNYSLQPWSAEKHLSMHKTETLRRIKQESEAIMSTDLPKPDSSQLLQWKELPTPSALVLLLRHVFVFVLLWFWLFCSWLWILSLFFYINVCCCFNLCCLIKSTNISCK